MTLRRIDPDEPWRYRCPDCGSPSVHANNGGFQSHTDAAYRCRKPCGWRGDKVIDAKADDLRNPTGQGGANGEVPGGAL